MPEQTSREARSATCARCTSVTAALPNAPSRPLNGDSKDRVRAWKPPCARAGSHLTVEARGAVTLRPPRTPSRVCVDTRATGTVRWKQDATAPRCPSPPAGAVPVGPPRVLPLLELGAVAEQRAEEVDRRAARHAALQVDGGRRRAGDGQQCRLAGVRRQQQRRCRARVLHRRPGWPSGSAIGPGPLIGHGCVGVAEGGVPGVNRRPLRDANQRAVSDTTPLRMSAR